jgi:hypothetical protein
MRFWEVTTAMLISHERIRTTSLFGQQSDKCRLAYGLKMLGVVTEVVGGSQTLRVERSPPSCGCEP